MQTCGSHATACPTPCIQCLPHELGVRVTWGARMTGMPYATPPVGMDDFQRQGHRERTQLGMPVLNEASNQRKSAGPARKKRRAGRGRPPAKPFQTPPQDPPSCHPRFLPPPSARNQNPTDLQTTMEGSTPPTDTSSRVLWKTALAFTHSAAACGALAGRHSSVLNTPTGSHQAS
eukprot:364943-Chlamydomonas_euryale.AAC.13